MNFKYYKITPLVIAVLISAGLIEACVSNFINPLLTHYLPVGSHFRVPTTVSILMIIFALYDNYMWKWPILNLLIKAPNMNGRYKGAIKYVWNGVNAKKNCVIEIIQTASKIKIRCYFSDGDNENTLSTSLVEEIKEEEDGFFDIYLFYFNHGTKQDATLDAHEGANRLRFHPASKTSKQQLIGHYFTNRKTQTRGTIEVELESKEIQGKY